jgi:hypothetical protein
MKRPFNADERSSRIVFIVRLWREGATPQSWRGQVQSISTGQVTAISGLDELLAYFQCQCNLKTVSSSDDHHGLK